MFAIVFISYLELTREKPAVLKTDLLSLKIIYSRSLKSAQDTASAITKTDVTPELYSADSGAGKSFEDVLQREDISAVIIALPINSQGAYIEAALKAGKHVLAEKPVAADVAAAKKLIQSYKTISAETKATFAVAENFRFQPRFTIAAEEAKKLGRLTHFTVQIGFMVAPDNKYYATQWRQKPEFQGGFVLDGGVHFAAATRLLLSGDKADTARAFTAQVQPHLIPLDTVNAIVRTKSGISGTFQQSVGTLLSAFKWDFGYEKGSVTIEGDTVIVKPAEGETTSQDYKYTSGVSEEVAAWAEALQAGKPNPLQSPEEALGDLEFLEKMFRSGEQDGAAQKYELQ